MKTAFSFPLSPKLALGDPDAFTVRIVNSFASMEGVWRAFQAGAYCSSFQDYDWLRGYLQATKGREDREVVVVVVTTHQILRMIVPLEIDRRMGVSRLLWLGHEINDYNAPIVDLDWARELTTSGMRAIWKQILAELPRIDYVHFQRQPAMLEGVVNPFSYLSQMRDTCGAYAIDVEGNWNEAYARLRSTKSRRRLREKLKRLGKEGKVRLRRIRDRDEQLQVLHQVIAWKDQQLRRKGGRNPFFDGEFERILASIFDTSGQQGPVRLFVLEVGNCVVAATLCLIGRDHLNYFITGHDPDAYQQCSVGTLMMVKLMELTARSGRGTFDLSCGDELYKKDWSVATTDLLVTQIALNARGQMVSLLETLRIAAIRLAKSQSKVVQLAGLMRREMLSFFTCNTNATTAVPPGLAPLYRVLCGRQADRRLTLG